MSKLNQDEMIAVRFGSWLLGSMVVVLVVSLVLRLFGMV